MLAGGRGAGEGDLVDVRVCDQRLARLVTTSGDHVDHAVGQVGTGEQLGQAQGAQRRRLRRLEDHRVARGQGRSELAGELPHRAVPAPDDAHHAQRLLARVGKAVAPGGYVRPEQLRGPAGVVAEDLAGLRQHGGGDRARRAHVHRIDGGELVGVLLDDVGDLVQDPAAAVRCHLRPGGVLERLACGLGRRVHIGGVTAGNGREGLFGGRVGVGQRLPGHRVGPLSGDPHPPVAVPYERGKVAAGFLCDGRGEGCCGPCAHGISPVLSEPGRPGKRITYPQRSG